MDLGAGTEEERATARQQHSVRGQVATHVKLEVPRKVLGRLCTQKAAGVDATTNVFLRRVFDNGDAETVGDGAPTLRCNVPARHGPLESHGLSASESLRASAQGRRRRRATGTSGSTIRPLGTDAR